MNYDILSKITDTSALRSLSDKEADLLCDEIRQFLIEKVSKSGGHLASNLGVVELSVALHKVFDSPKDHIIFDVGHQSYVHKMLTGRMHQFDTLRTTGGLSGFTSRRESEHDPFGAGHSSTALSAALGFAESDRMLGNDVYSIAVVGDGAYTGGMIHEAINNCKPDLKLIVILNENGMSISSNKGAFASYVSRFRTSRKYINAKEGARSALRRIPFIGKPIARAISALKGQIKRMVYETNYFEELGFYYIGPIDGNDRKKVERALQQAKDLGKCVFVHLKTTKGKGYEAAENEPERFHSVAGGTQSDDSFHSVFADSLIRLADNKEDVVAITAAMGIGTGLSAFEERFGNRYFDVGIAEAHALTFSAALEANGLKPYIAIYSTFLQRGYDSIVHDIALQNLPVRIFIDRAGLAVSDGPTHHGIFDVAFLSHIPGVEILSPVLYDTLERSVAYSYEAKNPIAVRYPNLSQSNIIKGHPWLNSDDTQGWIRCDFAVTDAPKRIFVTYGQIAERVIEAKCILAEQGVDCGIVLVERIKPYEPSVDFLANLINDGTHLVYVEEGVRAGGAGMNTMDVLQSRGLLSNVRFDIAAIEDFANPAHACDLYDAVGLSVQKLAEYFID